MTISSVDYALKAGTRLDENTLTLQIRASKGGRHRIAIPCGRFGHKARIQRPDTAAYRYGVRGDRIPVQSGRTVRHRGLAQQKGQRLARSRPRPWTSNRTRVNVRMHYEIPKDRWILLVLGNPLMGSQVRFWSYCIAVLIGAFLLGMIPWSPLKRWQWFLLSDWG